MIRRAPLAGLVAGAALATTLAAPSTAASSGSGPVGPEQHSYLSARTYASLHPTAVPPGANDFSCKPSAAHPNPVVLVEGTYQTAYSSWSYLAPELKKQGYCVFAQELPKDQTSWWKGVSGANATAPVMDSARATSTFVDRVRSSTHAKKVDMIGWSQGGIVIRGYAKFFGGADAAHPSRNKIGKIVTLGATNHGTTLSGLGTLANKLGHDPAAALASQSGADQLVGSDYLRKLNAGGDTMPGLDYTVIGTDRDEVSTPWTNTFLKAGPGAKVHNVHLQDGCALIGTEHMSLPYNQRVLTLAENALDPAHPAPLQCRVSFPNIN